MRLNEAARADLAWWKYFPQAWNGRAFFPPQTPVQHIFSDTSGNWECEAFSQPLGWFNLKWPEGWDAMGIATKELVPIVMAAATWGPQWNGQRVCFHSDNMAVVAVINCNSTREPSMMHSLGCLCFFAAYYQFQYMAEHIAGVYNTAADALSRDNLSLFCSLCLQIPRVTINPAVVAQLVSARPNWGSKA